MNLFEQARFLHRAWKYRIRDEPDELAFMRQHVQPGGTVIDIGAHKGAWTYWMARLVGPSGCVVAFEPQPELARYLTSAAGSLRMSNVKVVNAAASSHTGHRKLFRPDSSPSMLASFETEFSRNSSEALTVGTESLDQFLARDIHRPVQFIKCDAEGHELDVFQGAEHVLTEDRPTLLFECEKRHHKDGVIQPVFDLLSKMNYDGFYFDTVHRCKLRSLENFRLDMQDGPVRSRDYVNNFVFRPQEQSRPGAAA